MDKSSDKSPDEGKKAEPEIAQAPAGEPAATPAEPPPLAAIDSNLPVVESPKLDGSETIEPPSVEVVTEALEVASEPAAEETAAPAAPPRSWRFALLAATIALAAALGSFTGSLTGSGVSRLVPESVPNADIADTSAILRGLKSQVAELAAMKSSLDGAIRNTNTQFVSIADRLDRVERAASNPAAQLAHIADTVDRLNKLNAAPETTSSIATTAVPPSEPKITDRIVENWVVQDVHGDRALVENRNGGLFEVGAGSFLPGLGRVETVKRLDGQWVVVTARGLITSGR
jgi:hypothetical protein